jgi:hypothetical protein
VSAAVASAAALLPYGIGAEYSIPPPPFVKPPPAAPEENGHALSLQLAPPTDHSFPFWNGPA